MFDPRSAHSSLNHAGLKVGQLGSLERETILRALEDPAAGLEELRAVLLREHVGRVRDGLV